MTKPEKLIVSAYTGVLMVDQKEFHQFAEKVLKRHIQDYEFVTQSLWEILKRKTKKKFMELCEEN
jgi:hypothetical protein